MVRRHKPTGPVNPRRPAVEIPTIPRRANGFRHSALLANQLLWLEARLISAARAARQPAPRAVSGRVKEREMDNLIARVATAANTSPEIARKAVALIGDFIQREAPEEAVRDLFEKAPAFPAIIASSTATGGEGMGGGLKGLMGVAAGAMGGGGLMALGSELMGLGLGMDQIQTAGKEVFAYAREVAGDQTVGEIAASIPGLSQFI
jgi:hypothetical protein